MKFLKTYRLQLLGCLLPFVLIGSLILVGGIALRRRLDPELQDPAGVVAAAHQLLDEQRRDRSKYQEWLQGEDIPDPIRIPNLQYVYVHGDHVDLAIQHTPDGPLGFRVWSADAKRPHADRPTRYPGIFKLAYTNDLPESPDNLP